MALSRTVCAGAGEGSVPSATICYLAVIQEIQSDGTLVLDNQRKVKLPAGALQLDDQIRAGEEIVILTKAGLTQLDSQGRILGTMLVLDPNGETGGARGFLPEDLSAGKSAIPSRGYDQAARSTVAPPVGIGIQLFREEAAALMTLERETGLTSLDSPDHMDAIPVPSDRGIRGGTFYFENGREIRMPNNVFRLPAAVKAQHRLLFCAK